MSKPPPPTSGTERDLLASIGSSVADASAYEDDVLRSAELDAVPQLSGVGFPVDSMLKSLSASGSPAGDLPHVKTVLGRVRAKIANLNETCDQDEADMLYFQEQILLSFIKGVSGSDVEMHVHPREEQRQEHSRRQRLGVISKKKKEPNLSVQKRSSTTKKAVSNFDFATFRIGGGPNPNLKLPPGPAMKKKSALRQTKMLDPFGEASQRLEEIKKGSSTRRVSFAAQAATKGAGQKRARMSIMKRREAESESDSKQEGDGQFEERKAHLKKMREEREARRRKRVAMLVGFDDTSEEEDDENGGDAKLPTLEGKSVEKETKNEDEGNHEECAKDDQLEKAADIENNGKVPADESNLANEQKDLMAASEPVKESPVVQKEEPELKPEEEPIEKIEVKCPLCSLVVPIPDSSGGNLDRDAILSEHMSSCGKEMTGGPRRSRRNVNKKSYAEDTIEDTEELIEVEEPKVSRKRKAPTKTVTDANDEFVADSEESDSGDMDVVIEKAEINDLKEKPKRQVPEKKRRKIVTPPPRKAALDDMDPDDYEDRVEEWILTGVQNMKKMKEQDQNEIPPGEEELEGGLIIPAWINDRLFGYQRVALRFMWELHLQEAGGIIGDEMGLGKTVQICSFLGSLVSSTKVRSILIISPATMLQHWLSEMAKWAPGIRRFLIHQSGEGDGRSRTITNGLLTNTEKWLKRARRDRVYLPIDEEDIETRDPASFCGTAYAMITTYENIRRFPDIWTSHNWSYCIMDEAHKIRNPDADVTLAVKRLRTTHRIGLTGTPIQNDLKELWSLFDWAFPGRLGSLPAFENEFSDPIRRGGYSNASPMQVQLAYRCSLVLRDLINPYLLRRLKKDVKEVNRMPGKMEQVLFCRLNDRQRTMYEAFLRSPLVTRVVRGAPQLLAAVTTLRKICNHPDLICPPDDKSLDTLIASGFQQQADEDGAINDDYDADEYDPDECESLVERSGKLEVLAKILPLWNSQGHRVLIFCQWKKMLDIIQRFTQIKGWKFGRLDGNTSVASRQKLVDTFNKDKSYFGMLCTTRTGGVGLNMTGADRIILYDPDWNPQTDAQARERAWRFGQEREVTIYRLICAGSVEEKIYQRQIFKTALSNRVLQDTRQKRMFSQKDLKDLFTLKVDGGSIISGGEGITETAELTRGAGYVDVDEAAANPASKDDGETLKTVLKSKGLAGIFDHEVVESNDANKTAAVREMELQAARMAKEAVQALQESVSGQDAFTPTFTGAAGAGGRFGGSSATAPTSRRAGAAGIDRSSTGASSSNLLASFRKRNDDIQNGGASLSSSAQSKTKEFADLLVKIRNYIRRNNPTTDALLHEFQSVPNSDAAVFRRLLKSTAVVRGGKWYLK